MKNLGNQNAAVWTDARIDLLKQLWGDGLSASQVAARLGDTTRNAVIGKVDRLKLPKRSTVVSANVGGARKGAGRPKGSKSLPDSHEYLTAESKRRKLPTPPPMEPEPFDMEDGDGVDVTSMVGIMQNTGCKWIEGDPMGHHGYCGKPFKAGSNAWCNEHHARVYIGRGNRL